eukprot:CAMPEP_0203906764 /NCGR_PEP_ID=MMETSP0359-20131031/48353_1 /ASSEMBLY_ACC=CAM_ASM_000338 /TAXON_ID=268821 /ORGANISM="Scrippsiella Hangoei, Strain SHTV-5" /LENGTH=56 /DNA_ID=CAMNT_0050831465 /DNA_START=355 /DNA_END=525 /DNA_ORIENTATION=-
MTPGAGAGGKAYNLHGFSMPHLSHGTKGSKYLFQALAPGTSIGTLSQDHVSKCCAP